MTLLIVNFGVLLLLFGWVLFGWALCSSSLPPPPAKRRRPESKSVEHTLDRVERIVLGKPR